MSKHFSAAEKLALIKRISEGEPLARICKETGISRTILYQWIEVRIASVHTGSQEALKPKHPSGRQHWHALKPVTKQRILKKALEHPSMSSREIAKSVHVSRTTVWQLLKQYGLHMQTLREAHLHKYGARLVHPLPPEKKLQMIERRQAGERVVALCREYDVSRIIFYRWLKRYEQAGQKMSALVSQRPRGKKHYRYISKDFLLELVREQPELSARKLSNTLKQQPGRQVLCPNTIHTFLKKHNPTTYQQRRTYAESQRQGNEIVQRNTHSP